MAKKRPRNSYGKLKYGTRQEGYTYFYRPETWENARNSAGFLRWANGPGYKLPVKAQSSKRKTKRSKRKMKMRKNS